MGIGRSYIRLPITIAFKFEFSRRTVTNQELIGCVVAGEFAGSFVRSWLFLAITNSSVIQVTDRLYDQLKAMFDRPETSETWHRITNLIGG